jgi:hypothetical protein
VTSPYVFTKWVLRKAPKANDLEGYLQYLADEKPELFASLLGTLLPLQVRAKNESDGPVHRLNLNMSLPEMIDNFERRMKSIQVKELAPQ